MLSLKHIYKDFGDFSLNDFSISVNEGDYFVLLGESGAGKSIILELISGLFMPDSGTIHFKEQDITKTSIQKRDFGLVFQDYAIFPHFNVFDNIAYSLKNKHLSKKEIKNKVKEIAEKVEILHLIKRKTTTLSGGELQRVALARTLILKPKCLLLDEPFGSIDIKIKESLQNLLRKLNKQGQTIIHVTHDYEEALSLASKIAVIHKGKLIQEGKPEYIFKNPKNEFVAKFTGIKNFFKAKYTSINKVLVENKLSIRINPNEKMHEGYVMIPGETIVLSEKEQKSSAINNFKGIIINIISSRYGKEIIVDIGIPISVNITEESTQNLNLAEGKEIWLSFKVNSVKFI
ncbi:MAG: ABC transporter ATP-binding protein [Bacteroidales bacterium]|nr:ABC transporter ATP-binding protein [Bacteroidales bacterium]